MNKSKVFSLLIVNLLLSLSFLGCSKVQIELPDQVDLENVVLSEPTEKNNTPAIITDKKELKNIIDSIKLNSKKTNNESINDIPTNVDYYIKLEFSHAKGGSSVAYAYKTKHKYYIEQPYSGIWEIKQESYDNINTLTKAK